MKNDAIIRKALETILAPNDAAWESSVVAAHLHQAHSQFKAWSTYLAGPAPVSVWDARRTPSYVTLDKSFRSFLAPSYVSGEKEHADRLSILNAGGYSVHEERAIADGKDSYNQTREAFLYRVTEKLGYVLQNASITGANFQGEIAFNGAIEGYLNIGFEGVSFRITFAVKTNYRYGENSANGRLTVYSQYPTAFVYAVVNGEQLNDLSEELLANRISGIPIDHKIRTAQAVIDARNAKRQEKHTLEARKSALNSIADTYDSIDRWAAYKTTPEADIAHLDTIIAEAYQKIAAICTKHSITDPGSKKAARAAAKVVLAMIKAIGSVR